MRSNFKSKKVTKTKMKPRAKTKWMFPMMYKAKRNKEKGVRQKTKLVRPKAMNNC